MWLNSLNGNSWIEWMIRNFVFSKWKSLDKNEDAYFQNENMLILSDWATDKSWKIYEWKTWWKIISQIIVLEARKTTLNWIALVDLLNSKIQRFYIENKVDINNLLNIFSWTLVIVRMEWDKIYITQVGDTSFRINGTDLYTNNKLIDIITSILRKKFISKFWENFLKEARDFIMPILKIQNQYQNTLQELIFNKELLEYFFSEIRKNSFKEFDIEDILLKVKEELRQYFNQDVSYWTLDWRQTPERFIKVFVFDRSKIISIEVFSDWYFAMPENANITSWEELYEKTQKEDPLKYKKYPSTKSNDDRTVLISIF